MLKFISVFGIRVWGGQSLPLLIIAEIQFNQRFRLYLKQPQFFTESNPPSTPQLREHTDRQANGSIKECRQLHSEYLGKPLPCCALL